MNRKMLWGVIALIVVAGVVVSLNATRSEEQADIHGILMSLDVVSGERPTASDLQGRHTLVVIWTSWCPTCIQELHYIEDHYATIAEKVNLVAVNMTSVEQNIEDVHVAAEAIDPSYPVLADQEGKAGEVFRSRYVPANFLLDSDGRIVEKREGAITLDQLDEWLDP